MNDRPVQNRMLRATWTMDKNQVLYDDDIVDQLKDQLIAQIYQDIADDFNLADQVVALYRDIANDLNYVETSKDKVNWINEGFL